jgi:hypothetical protein
MSRSLDSGIRSILIQDLYDFGDPSIGLIGLQNAPAGRPVTATAEVGKHPTDIHPTFTIENVVARIDADLAFAIVLVSDLQVGRSFGKHGIDQKSIPVGNRVGLSGCKTSVRVKSAVSILSALRINSLKSLLNRSR